MCFGFRISSPLHLSTFQIPIQNFKYLKNAKTAWLSLQLSEIKLELCGLWFVSAPAVYSPKHEKCGKATHLLTIPQMWIMFSSKNIAAVRSSQGPFLIFKILSNIHLLNRICLFPAVRSSQGSVHRLPKQPDLDSRASQWWNKNLWSTIKSWHLFIFSLFLFSNNKVCQHLEKLVKTCLGCVCDCDTGRKCENNARILWRRICK